MMMYRWKWCDTPIGQNIINMDERVENRFVGTASDNVPTIPWKGCSVSDLLKVNPGEQYHFHSTAKDGGNGWGLFACFAKDQTFIRNVACETGYNTKDETVTIPADTYWVQVAMCYVSEIQSGAVVSFTRTA